MNSGAEREPARGGLIPLAELSLLHLCWTAFHPVSFWWLGVKLPAIVMETSLDAGPGGSRQHGAT